MGSGSSREPLLQDDKIEGELEKKKEPKVTAMQVTVIASIILVTGIDSICAAQFLAFMPDYFIEHGLDQTWIGITSTAGATGAVIASLGSAILSQKIGSSILFPAATFLAAIVQLAWGLIGALLSGVPLGVFITFIRFLSGLCDGAIQVTGMAMILRILPETYVASAAGGIEALRALGDVIAPVFGTQLYSVGGGATFWLPFVVISACVLAAGCLFAVTITFVPKGSTDQQTAGVKASLLVLRGPTIGLMVILGLGIFPMAALEPAIEPYLTRPPFNCSVQQVGLFFLMLTVSDMVSAGIGAAMVGFLGHVPSILVSSCLQILGGLLLAFTAQHFWTVWGSFFPFSFGMLPVYVAASALLMRICRTYNLDPKAYTEYISSLLTTTLTVAMGVWAPVAGSLVQHIGFRPFCMIAAAVAALEIPITLVAFSEWAIGGKLAVPIEETEEHKAEVAKEKAEAEAAKEAKKKAKEEAAAAKAAVKQA